MNYYTDVLKKYTMFTGRAGRKEFWMFTLWNVIIMAAIAIIENILAGGNSQSAFMLIIWIYVIAVFLPSIAVTLRRLRDAGFSPWWVLIDLVPFVGGIVLIVLLAQPTKPEAAMPANGTPPSSTM